MKCKIVLFAIVIILVVFPNWNCALGGWEVSGTVYDSSGSSPVKLEGVRVGLLGSVMVNPKGDISDSDGFWKVTWDSCTANYNINIQFSKDGYGGEYLVKKCETNSFNQLVYMHKEEKKVPGLSTFGQLSLALICLTVGVILIRRRIIRI